MVQVRSDDYHVARWAYSLYALQDLDLDAVDHGEGPADGRTSPRSQRASSLTTAPRSPSTSSAAAT